MKTVSIIGCGWLGLPLGVALLKEGYRVKGSTTQLKKMAVIEKNGINPYLIKLGTEMDAFSDFFESDVLIVNIPPSNTPIPENYFSQMAKLKSQTEKYTTPHILFISSTSVYPNLQRPVIESDASYEALTRSGISMLQAEDVFRDKQHTIIRFAGLIGPNRHPGRWFAGKSGLAGGNIPVNMIHLQDCIHVILTVVQGAHWGETFNACAPEHPQKRDYYPKCAKMLNLEAPTYTEETSGAWKIISSEKLVRQTGFSFERSVYDV